MYATIIGYSEKTPKAGGAIPISVSSSPSAAFRRAESELGWKLRSYPLGKCEKKRVSTTDVRLATVTYRPNAMACLPLGIAPTKRRRPGCPSRRAPSVRKAVSPNAGSRDSFSPTDLGTGDDPLFGQDLWDTLAAQVGR